MNAFAKEFRLTNSTDDSSYALELVDLSVAYRVKGKDQQVLQKVSLRIGAGEAYGLVGESGCGKSTVALAVQRHLPRNGRIVDGRIEINGENISSLDATALRALRATTVSMVYQDPGRALNPSLTVGRQVAEAFEAAGHRRSHAQLSARDLLSSVRIVAPERVMQSYPHQLSGGMQQRAVIAMALAKNPSLLILDEPTTALDVTVEAEILDLIAQLRREFSTAILLISHNLSVISRICDRVGVLYAGKLVEEGTTAEVLGIPRHPYTAALLRCQPGRGPGAKRKKDGPIETIPGSLPSPNERPGGCIYAPRCHLADDGCRAAEPAAVFLNGGDKGRMSRCHYPRRVGEPAPIVQMNAIRAEEPCNRAVNDPRPVLRVQNLSKTFHVNGQSMRAIDNVSFEIATGHTLGLVGESGSGKSTLAKLLLGMMEPDSGASMELNGEPLAPRVRERHRKQIKALQLIFQNPDSALNRSHSIRRLVGRSLAKLAGLDMRANSTHERLTSLFELVRLPARYLAGRTRQLSGGLKQRVAIACAFAGDPDLVVCDEPTSALDVSVQASILNLLVDLQARRNVSYLLISHDLNVVRYLADQIAVLYRGRIVEIGEAEVVFSNPCHPYTKALLATVQRTVSQSPAAPGVAANASAPASEAASSGCAFFSQCPHPVGVACQREVPPLVSTGNGRQVLCHLSAEELSRMRGEGEDVGIGFGKLAI